MNKKLGVVTSSILLVWGLLYQCECKDKNTGYDKNIEEILKWVNIDTNWTTEDSDTMSLIDPYLTVNISDLEWSPLFWSKRMIIPSYGNLLWFSQAESIVSDTTKWKNFNVKDVVNKDDTIKVPLIYPELRNYLPNTWMELKKGVFSDYQDIEAQDLLIVTQCQNGKNALAYYKNWKLTLATYVSIGTLRNKTITWEYTLSHDRIRRKSRKYNSSAMPYSICITNGFYLHQGRSDGTPLSHGCVRVPGLYIKYLYENLPSDSKIILYGLYEPTL